ncbi:lipopolysaccharide assembly protein LapA domain-containing protein [Candidiatus Paracoxiella cheracis]|uniref:lipopolysaccharide assembly protein LapA domain-containing protein n=1 Tax=Candidiatus Paracoxiella cheracis TaxID=3405120 RepID=UPI003BF4DB5B
MRYVIYIFWIIVILVGVTFASLNPQKLTLNYYVNTTTIHLPLLLLLVLVLGALLGVIAMLPSLIRAKSSNHHLKARVKQTEQEVQNLRSIPIKDTH